MKKIRNINTTTKISNRKPLAYLKPYPVISDSLNVLYPELMEYGGKIFEIQVMVIE